MRQGQQHRRGRSRNGQPSNHNNNNNNNNRKGQNPISRNYQSNGPDGKVSGTASSIAEKYLSLARDAVSSSDHVLAENYLQHAEHYNRIILAYREQLAQNDENGQGNGRPRNGQPNEAVESGDDSDLDEGESYGRDMQPLPPMELQPHRQADVQPQPQPQQRAFDSGRDAGQRTNDGNSNRYEDRQQPRGNDQRRPQRDRFEPRERYNGDRFNNGDRQQNAGDRYQGQPRNDRFPNDRDGNRVQGERQPNDRPRYAERQNGAPAFVDRQPVGISQAELTPPRDAAPFATPARVEPQPIVEQPEIARADAVVRAPRPVRRERPVAAVPVSEHEQPEFLRRPVRRPRRDAATEDAPPAAVPGAEPSES